MAPDPIVFALANPDPEIAPEDLAGLARVVATGRSDYPNQINNVLAFPGIFRGALDVQAATITEEMKLAAARAIAAIVGDEERSEEYIVPSVFNRRVAEAVAAAVAEAAVAAGVARRPHAVAGAESAPAARSRGAPRRGPAPRNGRWGRRSDGDRAAPGATHRKPSGGPRGPGCRRGRRAGRGRAQRVGDFRARPGGTGSRPDRAPRVGPTARFGAKGERGDDRRGRLPCRLQRLVVAAPTPARGARPRRVRAEHPALCGHDLGAFLRRYQEFRLQRGLHDSAARVRRVRRPPVGALAPGAPAAADAPESTGT